MNIAKLQQNIKDAEEALERMKQELEDAERVDSNGYYPHRFNPDSVNYILNAIDEGECKYLRLFAFDWHETPQGYTYWENKIYGKIPLSDEDKITLLRWCVNYYRSKNS